MHFRRQRRHDDSVNLTPLIDVVFLLLIFFMVTTTFTKETHLTLDLPEASGEPNPQQKPMQLEIVVSSRGEYSINGNGLINNKPETLLSGLKEISGGDTKLPLIISADADASHQSVVTAMDIAGQLGFTQLSITTRRAESE